MEHTVCSITMLRSIIKVCVLIFLVNQVPNICGKLTTLCGPTNGDKKKVICLSEDDGGALVWNADITYEKYYHTYAINRSAKPFLSVCNRHNSQIDCKLNIKKSCLDLWDREHWTLTNSIDTPMGLVFDQRWEDFQENTFDTNIFHNVILNNTNTIVLAFSVRAKNDVHIAICNQEYTRNLCYWVIIGGWANTKSVIRKCPIGIPDIGVYPEKFPRYSECAIQQAYLYHMPLAAYEWRSFVLTWNSTTRNISLYDSNRQIVTYRDKDNYTTQFTSKVYMRSPSSMLVRYHEYNYLHTRTPNAILTSNMFSITADVLCLQMLIGLCAECDADILLRTSITNETLQTITVKGSSAVYGLPMWQFIKIIVNETQYSNYGSLKIVMIPKLNLISSSNPLWAIADVRGCSINDCLRETAVHIQGKYVWNSGTYIWPSVTCQKLFYKEQSVVDVFDDVDLNTELEDNNCPVGYIGPACMFNCNSTFKTKTNCKSTVICNDNGCTCAPGYKGRDCSLPCDNNFYGHNCKMKCGSCLNDKQCDRVSGECYDGCKQQTREYFYVPPLCKINISAPNETQFTYINQTTIVATVPIVWEKKYEEIKLSYKFRIETLDKKFTDELSEKTIFQNSKNLVGIFENLKSGMSYKILCIFLANQHPIYGEWKTVDTHCDPITDFKIIPNETSLEIMGENKNQLHPCPVNSYNVLTNGTDDETENKIIGEQFSYSLLNLIPYTPYNITILNRGEQLFSKVVYTLEGVPSEVLSLQASPLSSTNVSLLWAAPQHPHGIIKKYVVNLTVAEYFGCKNTKPPPLSNYGNITETTTNTEIILSGLHAFAKYNVQVTAYNSRRQSKSANTSFALNASTIPAVTFSRPKMQDWELSWSPPEDCTTILGPLSVAQIEIQGISDAVKNYNVTKKTQLDSINLRKTLYGNEHYVAKIFVLRGFNQSRNMSAFEKVNEFKTPPKEPPNVTNLEVVEVENQETIYLRWQSPRPPLNGKLWKYGINKHYKNIKLPYTVIPVRLNETCSLWDNYMCKNIKYTDNIIRVVAYNMNVSDPGSAVEVTEEMLNNATPEAPRNFSYSIGNNSVVNLKWLHPLRTGRRLDYFNITVETITSNLRGRVRRFIESKSYTFNVTNYMRNYPMLLHLLPSTKYNISIKSVTIENKESNTEKLNFWTPSTIHFNGNITFDEDESDSTIKVKIPPIMDDTRNSILYIIVKGRHGDCDNVKKPRKDLWEEADVQKSEKFWQAAAILTCNISEGKTFTLGNSETYDNGTNCPLISGESYHITVIIREHNSPSYKPIIITNKYLSQIGDPPPNHPEAWLIPFLIILVAAAAVFYFFQSRKRQKLKKQLMLQDEMILSQNIETFEHDTKSVISNSKQTPSTPSDRQSLSRATTPEVTIAVQDNDEEEEITSLVKVKNFEDYVKQAINSGLLDRQYETFLRGQTQPWDYGKQPQNKTKNRYGNLIAYDETRVILKKLPDDAYSDYINANYITGYKKKKRYIATQGPKPNTVVDFWRMIWQEKVLIICMLANVVENGKTKCEQYWPDIGKKKKYGEIIVLNATHNVFADYCFRILHVTYGKETRKVEHLHYTAWPDHGVPMYTHSVVTYLKKLLATPPGNGSVVVHCSAGVGRTGTIILCDICLHRAAAEGVVDVFAETASIRRERANMVDNKQQYLLAHLALVECLLTIPTTLPCNETLPMRIKELKTQLPLQQQRLQNTAWQDEALRPATIPLSLSEHNQAKNRFPELISDKVSRIYLKRYPTSDEDSDYLSAVYVDGVKFQNQYLATQLPMPSTINDFWRMIAEFKVELIVMLQLPDPEDSTCCAIAPASGEFKPTPYLNITAKEIVELENYTLQKLLLVNNSEKPSREHTVTILCCTEWKPGRNQPPPSVMTMVTFWQATERIARGDGPTVTLCHDGVTGCGLYLALSFMLERMAVERECDVCLAVRAVRRSRPDFVRSLEQLEYLYDAAMAYMEYFETYANFS